MRSPLAFADIVASVTRHFRISHTPQAIEPGYSLMSDSGKKAILAEVASIIGSIGATHGKVGGCLRVFRCIVTVWHRARGRASC